MAEERSIELHREVARRLRNQPELLEEVRRRVTDWLRNGTVHDFYAQACEQLLSQPLEEVRQSLTDPSQRMRDMRRCSPFAGVIDPRTRWRILREGYDRMRIS